LWVTVSTGAAFLLLEPRVATLLIAVGLAFFLILRLPVAFQWRVLTLGAIFAVLIYGRATRGLSIPASFYPVFGAIWKAASSSRKVFAMARRALQFVTRNGSICELSVWKAGPLIRLARTKKLLGSSRSVFVA